MPQQPCVCRPGESESWDFGVGAGFYLNATEPKWKNWRMYDYVTKELPGVLKGLKGLNVDNVRSHPAVAPSFVVSARLLRRRLGCDLVQQ